MNEETDKQNSQVMNIQIFLTCIENSVAVRSQSSNISFHDLCKSCSHNLINPHMNTCTLNNILRFFTFAEKICFLFEMYILPIFKAFVSSIQTNRFILYNQTKRWRKFKGEVEKFGSGNYHAFWVRKNYVVNIMP